MARRPLIGFIVSLALIAVLTAPAGRAETPDAAPLFTLTKIKEIREIELAKPDENSFSMDNPGLELHYDLRLPDGLNLLQIAQPTKKQVTSTDSAGTDLSAIEPNFMDRFEFVKVIEVYGEGPKGFTFHLALPARQATSFDLEVDLEATTFNHTEEITAEVTTDWTDLDASLFGTKKVQAKLTRNGQGLQLSVRPGSVKSTIADVQLFNDGTELESSFTMWNDSVVNYAFNGDAADAMTAKIKVRTGLSTRTLTIALEDQPLP